MRPIVLVAVMLSVLGGLATEAFADRKSRCMDRCLASGKKFETCINRC